MRLTFLECSCIGLSLVGFALLIAIIVHQGSHPLPPQLIAAPNLDMMAI